MRWVMHEALMTAVSAYRLGMEGAGNQAFVAFIEGWMQEIESGVIRGPVEKIELLLAEIIEGQQRGDYLWVADLLEFEVAQLV